MSRGPLPIAIAPEADAGATPEEVSGEEDWSTAEHRFFDAGEAPAQGGAVDPDATPAPTVLSVRERLGAALAAGAHKAAARLREVRAGAVLGRLQAGVDRVRRARVAVRAGIVALALSTIGAGALALSGDGEPAVAPPPATTPPATAPPTSPTAPRPQAPRAQVQRPEETRVAPSKRKTKRTVAKRHNTARARKR